MDFTSNPTSVPVMSHVEAVYRPGERQLAIDLFEAIGCKTYDTGMSSVSGSTYISVHPDPGERGHDNVLYLSEMPAEQRRLEEALRRQIESDDELSSACDAYRAMADERPYGLSHLAVRYPSREALEEVLGRLEQGLPPELSPRARLTIFRPGDSAELGGTSVQAFIYTDIAVAGISAFGQLLELCAYE